MTAECGRDSLHAEIRAVLARIDPYEIDTHELKVAIRAILDSPAAAPAIVNAATRTARISAELNDRLDRN